MTLSNETNTDLPPTPVPRVDSLLHRLQQAPDAESQSYVDQLMIFLEDPPVDVRDRWKEGAKMCGEWGIETSGAAVWRLYRSQVFEWRLRLARETSPSPDETPQSLQEKTAQLVSLRALELLANPQSSPACLVSLARIEFRKQALEFARQKHRDHQTGKIQLALEELEKRVRYDRYADFALKQLKEALDRKDTPAQPFPFLNP